MAVAGPGLRNIKYLGLSTDTKPTVNVLPLTRFFETDTGKTYVFNGTTWVRE